MNDLSHHLSHLLLENDCAILPGIGGFMARDIPAYYVEDEQLFFPPTRTAVFNAALTANDGLLAQQLMQSHKISYGEACHLLERYVDEITDTLLLEGSVELNGIGTLRQDIEGARSFTPCAEGLAAPAHFGLPSVPIASLAVLRAEESEPATPLIAASATPETIHIRVGRRAIRTIAAAAAAVALVILAIKPISKGLEDGFASFVPSFLKNDAQKEMPLAPKAIIEIEEVETMQSIPESVAIVPESAETISETAESIIENVESTVESTEETTFETTETAESIDQPTETVGAETVPADIPQPTAPASQQLSATPQTTVSVADKRYHVIVASIAGRNGAEETRMRFAAKGYDDVTLLECDGRTRISLASFADKDEANAFIAELRAKTEFKNAWLLPVKQ